MSFSVQTDLWSHQNKIVRALEDCGLVWADPGVGKTLATLKRCESLDTLRTLVVGPSASMDVWENETEKHCDPAPLVCNPTEESISDRVYTMHDAYLSEEQTLFLANYTSLDYPAMVDYLEWGEWDVLVSDESHLVKNPTGSRSKTLASITRNVPYNYLLTGTPMPNGYEDLFAQFRIMDPSVWGASWYSFRDRYCRLDRHRNIVGYKNTDEIHEAVEQHTVRVTDDVLDLPEKQDTFRYTRLNDRDAAQSEQWWMQLQAESDPDRMHGPLHKMQRLANQEKPSVLMQTLQGIPEDEPIVIFASYHSDIDNIQDVCEQLGREYYEYSGRVKERDQWDEGVLIVQIQAGSVSISLTQARYGIFYNPTYKYDEYHQARKRVHRPGQDRPVTYIHLIAERSIDEQKMKALQRKQDLVDVLHEETV